MSAPLPFGFASPTLPTDRDRIELEIERLIALLDALDGDDDIELTGDEEDQSYREGWGRAGQYYLEDDEDSGDDEENGDADRPRNTVSLNPRPIPTKRIRRSA